MNIRPDTALHQVISELLGQAGRAVRPSADAPATAAPAKKPQATAATAPTAGAPASPAAQSGPTQPRPRGSLINILA